MLNWEPMEFFQKGCNMTHFVKSEDDAAKSILDSLAMLDLLIPYSKELQ